MEVKRLRGEAYHLARELMLPLSPDEFRTDLPDARITGIGDIPEASVTDIPARIRELRVIEYVEEFTPNLERLSFCNRDRLLES